MTKHVCNKEGLFTQIFVAQESLQKDVRYIRKSIDGNGSPGLIKKAEEANEYIIAQKQKDTDTDAIELWSRKKLLFWLGALLGLPGMLLIILQIMIIYKLNIG